MFGLASAFSASGCIPHPDKDFDSYNERTAQYREIPDAATSDSAPPAEPVKGLYFGACLSKLAAGRVDRVLRFYTEVDFLKDANAPTGTITIKLTALKLGPNNGPPAAVSKAETVGTTYTINNVATNALGVYDGTLGQVKIPGEANPISGREIIVEQAGLPGRFAPGTFCSQLVGQVTQPTEIELEGAANTCIYIPVKEGDATPVLKVDGSDFKGGCALQ
jgi:hypothetical protein